MKKFFSTLFSFAVVVGVFWVGGWALIQLVHKVLDLPQPIVIAVITATVVPIGSVASFAVGKYYEGKRAREQEIRQKKTVAYEALLEIFTSTMRNFPKGKDADGELTPEFISNMDTVHRGLVIWGSDEVLRRWSRFRRRTFGKMASGDLLGEMENLMRAIRTDIGHSNKSLMPGDVLGIFINDIPIPEDKPVKSIAKAAVDTLAKKEP